MKAHHRCDRGNGHMTRSETLLNLLCHAYTNGFDFRAWFQANMATEWPGSDEAVALLASEGRFHALIFSHDFARALWKRGAQMNFTVPALTYSRVNMRGEVVTINRKPFTRRTIKADVWKYHLREMAVSEDPILYLRRFLPGTQVQSSLLENAQELSAAG
jgi:hypothetical protein